MISRRNFFATVAQAPVAIPILATAALAIPDEPVVTIGKGFMGDVKTIYNKSKTPIRVLPDNCCMLIITG